MSLRKAIKAVLPGHKPPKTYASWDAVAAAAGSYDDATLNTFRAARAQLNLKSGWEPDILRSPLSWLCSLLVGELHVVDFGGATGEIGAALMRRYPLVRVTVVETPGMAALAPTPGIQFSAQAPGKCDIFHTSGALQYLDDPYGVVQAGFRSAWQAVAFCRNCFHETEVFSVQRSPLTANGGGVLPEVEDRIISYPHRTISEAKIMSLAAASGFRLVSRVPTDTGVPSGHEGYGADLVFLKE